MHCIIRKLFSFIVLLFIPMAVTANEQDVNNTVQTYLDFIVKSNAIDSYGMLSKEDRSVLSLDEWIDRVNKKGVFDFNLQPPTHNIRMTNLDGEKKAKIYVEQKTINSLFLIGNADKTKQDILNGIEDGSIPSTTKTLVIHAVKESGEWKIFKNIKQELLNQKLEIFKYTNLVNENHIKEVLEIDPTNEIALTHLAKIREKENRIKAKPFEEVYLRELSNVISEHFQGSYPPLAQERGQEGTVEVGFTILKTGEIVDVHVKKSSRHLLLDDAALSVFTDKMDGKFKPIPENIYRESWRHVVPMEYKLSTK
jgi:TonB family protein